MAWQKNKSRKAVTPTNLIRLEPEHIPGALHPVLDGIADRVTGAVIAVDLLRDRLGYARSMHPIRVALVGVRDSLKPVCEMLRSPEALAEEANRRARAVASLDDDKEVDHGA
jgi:hypothetical protein